MQIRDFHIVTEDFGESDFKARYASLPNLVCLILGDPVFATSGGVPEFVKKWVIFFSNHSTITRIIGRIV